MMCRALRRLNQLGSPKGLRLGVASRGHAGVRQLSVARTAHDVPLTCVSSSSADSYDEALDDYLGFRGGAAARLESATAADPSFLMGHVMYAALHLLSPLRRGHESSAAQAGLACASASAAEHGSTRGERLHLLAMEAWVGGRPRAAANLWELVLRDSPCDLFALRCLHDVYLSLGDWANLRGSVARALPSWRSEMPGFHYVMSMHAYALLATGAYREAEETALRALGSSASDTWAVHAAVHVMEGQGRVRNTERCAPTLWDGAVRALGREGPPGWALATTQRPRVPSSDANVFMYARTRQHVCTRAARRRH